MYRPRISQETIEVSHTRGSDPQTAALGKQQEFSRRDLFIAAACLAAGSAAVAGIALSTPRLQQVAARELVADPDKFAGSLVQIECTLMRHGPGTLVYEGSGLHTTDFPRFSGLAPSSNPCELFAIKGLESESFFVAVASDESAPITDATLAIEGIVSEAILNGKRVHVLKPRTVSLAPLPFPAVPF